MRTAPVALDDILEDQWDAQLFRGKDALTVMLGWTSYHVLRAKGSRAGYPDRTLVRDRIIFAELKRDLTGRKSEDANRQPSPAQIEWLDKLATAGGEVYLWRPGDLDEIAKVLSSRWTLDPAETVGPSPNLSATWFPPRLFRDDYGGWTPASLWIPGVGRADTTRRSEAA
ncbi:MAG TPA: hypothetical protein VFY10_11585 [Dehalococcoidia bacterium]|nr:hypothetical protein [Dehalococcoidia bacterium]